MSVLYVLMFVVLSSSKKSKLPSSMRIDFAAPTQHALRS